MHDDDVPFASEAYVMAWPRLWERFLELLPVAVVWFVFAAVEGVLHYAGIPGASLYDLLVVVPLNFGALYVYLRAARGEPVDPSHLFQAFRTAYWRAIGAHLMFVVLVIAGLIAFVVPGFIVAARLSFVGFLVMDEGLDPAGAIRESWLAGRVLLLWLLGIPIWLAGSLFFGVGVVPAVMWIHLAFATLFVGVTEGCEEAADVSAARPTPEAT